MRVALASALTRWGDGNDDSQKDTKSQRQTRLLSDAGQATGGPGGVVVGGESREVEEWSSRAQQVNAGKPMGEVVGSRREGAAATTRNNVEGGQE